MTPISALDLAQQIDAEALSPMAALERCYQAVNQFEPRIHAFAHLASQAATIAALRPGPLAGIAIGIKDIFDTHDMPTEYGSPIYQGNQPSGDAAVVNRCRVAGGSIIGKTVTTEFAWFEPGNTRNPHNIAHTPGGSSSGSAAGVAAGFFPAALGSQTGGSTIRPAAFCGIAGYKPSFRLFPTLGMKQFSWSLDTVGWFAKSIADIAFIAENVSGRALRVDRQSPDLNPVIGIYRGHNFDEASPSIQQALESTIQAIKASGSRIVELPEIREFTAAHRAHSIIEGYECGIALGDEFDRNPDLLSPKIHAQIKMGQSISPEEYDNGRRTARRARKVSHQAFENIDVILTLSAPGAAPLGLESTGSSTFNRLWTLLGVPCVNVPGLKNENGLPLGLQIIAPFGQDHRALSVAHWLEQRIFAKNELEK